MRGASGTDKRTNMNDKGYMSNQVGLSPIEEALEDFRQGKFVIVVDD